MNEHNISTDKLNEWKSKLNTICPTKAEYEKWLFIQTSRTLFGGKTGELITIQEGQFGFSLNELMKYTEQLCTTWSVDFKQLQRNEFSCKFLVYREDILTRKLVQPIRWLLHERLNYKPDLNAKNFLDELSRRWQNSGTIPHEIGIALGYPLKDVMGYMGLSLHKCTGSCGWQVFGDPKPSVKRSRRYQNAHQEAIRFLYTNKPFTPEPMTNTPYPIT
jgi:hypothetical protein